MEVDLTPNPWLTIADRLSRHAETILEQARRTAEDAQSLAGFLKENPGFSPANPEDFAGRVYNVLTMDRHTCEDLLWAIYEANPNYGSQRGNRLLQDLVTRTRQGVEDAKNVHGAAKFFQRQRMREQFKKMRWF